jgi:hypothetical protein
MYKKHRLYYNIVMFVLWIQIRVISDLTVTFNYKSLGKLNILTSSIRDNLLFGKAKTETFHQGKAKNIYTLTNIQYINSSIST